MDLLCDLLCCGHPAGYTLLEAARLNDAATAGQIVAANPALAWRATHWGETGPGRAGIVGVQPTSATAAVVLCVPCVASQCVCVSCIMRWCFVR
jgi:hypothetical protein